MYSVWWIEVPLVDHQKLQLQLAFWVLVLSIVRERNMTSGKRPPCSQIRSRLCTLYSIFALLKKKKRKQLTWKLFCIEIKNRNINMYIGQESALKTCQTIKMKTNKYARELLVKRSSIPAFLKAFCIVFICFEKLHVREKYFSLQKRSNFNLRVRSKYLSHVAVEFPGHTVTIQ